MTGVEIACDNEFTEGSGGQLQLRGVQRDVPWPYSNGGPAAGSALYVDPNQGLWSPRRDPVVGDMEQTFSGGGTSIAANKQYAYPYAQVTVTNPSDYQRAVLHCAWFFEWSVNVRSGAVADVHSSIIRMNNRTSPNWKHAATHANLQPAGSTKANPTFTWIDSRTETDIEYLEAGQASTYRSQLRVLCGSAGSLTANYAKVSIKILGMLI